ncbi:RNA-directed DNA polymerase from mobile element jockey [Trichonephila clavipes]|nr:RNA-directed DNA polymerase from mobile element jockey [Trichonephila clavipes]
MSKISPFAIHKTLIGIGGEPKSVKRLRSVDLLIETMSDLQTKSFLLAKTFFNSPVTVSPHKTLNSCRGVISEPDLLSTPDAEILEGFSDQGVIQVARTSIISTASQTDPNLSNIICPPLQCLTPISSKDPLPGTSSSVSTFSTSSSSTQDNLLPSRSVSPLETETRSYTTPVKLNSVSTENLPESVPNESNSEHSTAAEAQQIVKRKSRNRRKRPKVQKPDIEIKRVPHRSRNETPTEITTDDEDMITYDVEEEELEQDPFILPKGYLRALTPSRYRNYRE